MRDANTCIHVNYDDIHGSDDGARSIRFYVYFKCAKKL